MPNTTCKYYDWYYEPAAPGHAERYTMYFRFWPNGSPQPHQWYCYSYAPWSQYYGWTYYYNPSQNYYPWKCMNYYNPNWQGWGGDNWCVFQNGQWSDPGSAPNFPQTPDQVPDPPTPQPFNQNPPVIPL